MKASPKRLEHECRRKHRRRATNTKLVREEKIRRGCDFCHRKDLLPEQLEFHHRDQSKKRGPVSRLVSRATRSVIAEIALCRLLCRRCHRHFHATGETYRCNLALERKEAA